MNKSKQYFAKWLPVEGEIKEGNWVIGATMVVYRLEGEEWKTYLEFKSIATSIKRVKLFLCSRDIKVGDRILDEDLLQDERICSIDEIIGDGYRKWIRKIGEISPEATWVKEGDEFTADQLDVAGTEPDNFHSLSLILSLGDKEPNTTYYVKGSCGQFH